MALSRAVYTAACLLALLVALGLGAIVGKRLTTQTDRVIAYRSVDGQELSLHVFAPADQSLPGPALLLFHGGRWRYGSPENLFPQCRYFSAAGITCISVQYRLGTEGRADVPASLEDARAALDYVGEHAVEFGIDSERIAVGGASSGGHLAAALGVGLPDSAANPGGGAANRPAALVLYNPMLDLSPCRPDHHLVGAFWREVSPFHHIDAQTPPTLILLGTEDPEIPVATAQDFCSVVEGMGSQCELALYPGQTHGFFNPGRGDGQYFHATNRRVLDFLAGSSRGHSRGQTP